MRLQLIIDVPSSADVDEVDAKLRVASYRMQGITLTTAEGYAVDVVLLNVKGVD